MIRTSALLWMIAALVVGYFTVSIALAPKGDASGWFVVIGFAGATVFCVWRAIREWKTATTLPSAAIVIANTEQSGKSAANAWFPATWSGTAVPLEAQIAALAATGLSLAPGRTIDELLQSWSREDYERDPYNLLLFMYGSEVEGEPWGRFYHERGWNFDMECLEDAGDYVTAFTQILRIANAQGRITHLSDDFDIDAEHCSIKFDVDGQPVVIRAKVNNDWADPDAVMMFVKEIERLGNDGRRFWAADNGQASVLFFITDAEALAINALRPDVLQRYA